VRIKGGAVQGRSSPPSAIVPMEMKGRKKGEKNEIQKKRSKGDEGGIFF